jgi:hypothetical protein
MEVKIWPNPFNEQVSIQLNQPIFKIELFNLTGELVLEAYSSTHSITINTENQSSGSYIIRINQDGNSYFTRLIK